MSGRQANDIEGTPLSAQDTPYEYLFSLALRLVVVEPEAHPFITSM